MLQDKLPKTWCFLLTQWRITGHKYTQEKASRNGVHPQDTDCGPTEEYVWWDKDLNLPNADFSQNQPDHIPLVDTPRNGSHLTCLTKLPLSAPSP